MIPFGRAAPCSEIPVWKAFSLVPTGAFVARVAAWLAVSAVLLLAGWRVGEALGSPLLAAVASGMLFLIGVSLRSAIEPRRP
jgi:hypothetical protein